MEPRVVVLGTAQDGGVPQAGCACATCESARRDGVSRRRVACLGLVGVTGRRLLVDATPDLGDQVAALAAHLGRPPGLEEIVLTHAHMGHYLGLAHLGREAMGARGVPVRCTASMAGFLRGNRPWAHLVDRGEIRLLDLLPGVPFDFDGVTLEAFLVPHRAEDTDTVGIEIRGSRARLAYVPDADRFPPDLAGRLRSVDVALVDGTFHSPRELPGRDLTRIPHPFVEESVEVLRGARGQVWFTHLNHSNPLLDPVTSRRPLLPGGFGVLSEGQVLPL